MTDSLPLRARVPDRFNLGWHCADRWVELGEGHRPALHHDGGTLSYAELTELSNRIGNALRDLGLRRGDRFLIRLPNVPEAHATFLAGLKIGAVPIPTPTLLRERELSHMIHAAAVRLVVVSDELATAVRAAAVTGARTEHVLCLGEPQAGEREFAALIEAASADLAPADTAPDDPAFVLFTSGTSGKPKGVAHAHRAFNVTAGDPCGRWAMGLTPQDRVFLPHDLAWSYTLGCGFLFPLAEGAAVVTLQDRIQPDTVFDRIARHRPTIFASVPALYRRLLPVVQSEHVNALASLRFCMSAGEPLPPQVKTDWEQASGIDLLEHIGQVELSIFLANPPQRPGKPGSVGRPPPGYHVAVLSEQGEPCVGEVARLVVADDNPALFYDYLGMPESFRAKHHNGWYDTGDLAWVDEDGDFWYVSRADELITSRGYLISPWEVEEALVGHPSVCEAAVIGVPEPEQGEVVKAFVVLHDEAAPSAEYGEALRQHVKATIAPFKAPRHIDFVQELPKTATGKVQRRALRPSG